MKLIEKDGVSVLVFESFLKEGVTAAFSTRSGGVSTGVYESMNLGFHLEDDKQKVRQNFEIFANALGLNTDDFILSKQVHSDTIHEVNAISSPVNLVTGETFQGVDGFISLDSDVVLCTVYADCVPVYFYDRTKHIIGICHSGWRGTVLNIAGQMVDKFLAKGSKASDIIVGVGPSICGKCFEVRDDVINEFSVVPYASEYYSYDKNVDRYYLDLRGIIKRHVMEKGVPEHNIEVTDYCTFENEKLFYSHRRNGRARGTQVGVISLSSLK